MNGVLLQKRLRLLHDLVCWLVIVVLSIYIVCFLEVMFPKADETAEIFEKAEPKQEVHILTDEELSRLYSFKEHSTMPDKVEITVEDAQRLMKIAVAEDSTNEYSQAYIMSVVLNRVKSNLFPNTVEEVISQDKQFSTYSNGSYQKAVPNVDSHLALYLIESGQVDTEYLFFEAAWCDNTWQSSTRNKPFYYGGTKFYE